MFLSAVGGVGENQGIHPPPFLGAKIQDTMLWMWKKNSFREMYTFKKLEKKLKIIEICVKYLYI